jgi:hypothetical protein
MLPLKCDHVVVERNDFISVDYMMWWCIGRRIHIDHILRYEEMRMGGHWELQ